MPNDPTFLGEVQDVKGSTVSIALHKDTISGLTFINGHGYRIGQIGSFVRIPLGYIDLFGIVSQIGAGSVPDTVKQNEPYGYRWMTVQIVGEVYRAGIFSRGISQYPTIGDPAHVVTEDDLKKIYGAPDSPNFITVGHLASSESIPALVNIDKLVTRHSAIVGSTGVGKSTTVAGLLVSLSDSKKYPSARIIVLDLHGEYASALNDIASVYRINPDPNRDEKPLYIPYWAMSFDELIPITFGSLDDSNRGAILEAISSLKESALRKIPRPGVSSETLTVDSPIPFSIHKLWFDLHCLVYSTHTAPRSEQSSATQAFLIDNSGKIVQPGDPLKVIPPKYKPQNLSGKEKIYLSDCPLTIRRQNDYLASKLRDPRFDFLFRPGPWSSNEEGITQEDLDKLLEQWIGGPNPITILDLSGIPSSILNHLVGALLRIVYDALFWARNLSEGGRERPLLVVLEEAHTYLNQNSNSLAANAVKRIVKEGRKYGIGAMVVSQRPSEIDSTILSQCGTIFAMRLSNSSDRSHVTGTVTDNLEGLFHMLPSLKTGEAIIVGEAVHLPVRTLIDPPFKNRRPDSCDPLVYDANYPGGWNREKETSNYADLVYVWRTQNPRSPKIKNIEEGKNE
jgi:hypothetical protein